MIIWAAAVLYSLPIVSLAFDCNGTVFINETQAFPRGFESKRYPSYANCTWMISVAEGLYTRIDFSGKLNQNASDTLLITCYSVTNVYKNHLDRIAYKSIGPEVTVQLLGHSNVTGTLSLTVTFLQQVAPVQFLQIPYPVNDYGSTYFALNSMSALYNTVVFTRNRTITANGTIALSSYISPWSWLATSLLVYDGALNGSLITGPFLGRISDAAVKPFISSGYAITVYCPIPIYTSDYVNKSSLLAVDARVVEPFDCYKAFNGYDEMPVSFDCPGHAAIVFIKSMANQKIIFKNVEQKSGSSSLMLYYGVDTEVQPTVYANYSGIDSYQWPQQYPMETLTAAVDGDGDGLVITAVSSLKDYFYFKNKRTTMVYSPYYGNPSSIQTFNATFLQETEDNYLLIYKFTIVILNIYLPAGADLQIVAGGVNCTYNYLMKYPEEAIIVYGTSIFIEYNSGVGLTGGVRLSLDIEKDSSDELSTEIPPISSSARFLNVLSLFQMISFLLFIISQKR